MKSMIKGFQIGARIKTRPLCWIGQVQHRCRALLVIVSVTLSSIIPAIAGIPDVDSANWSTDPRAFGMSPREYIQAESRALFADFISRAGVNTFYNFPGVAAAADRFVVSPNNDTVYSNAVVNVRDGFTLELPKVGDRFLSAQLIDENHMTPFYLYGGGSRTFTPDQFETNYVGVAIRVGTSATKKDIRFVREHLQPQYRIVGAKKADDLVRPDLDVLAKVRAALVGEYSLLTSSAGAMQKRTDQVKDWEFFTYVTAGGWGLSADENAMYAPYVSEGLKGHTCYTATYPPVPAKAFFSITVYGPEKYLMSDKDNLVSSNREIITESDGSFQVAFGGEPCRRLAPNYVYTPKDGWSLLLRNYRPDVELFRHYQMPELIEVN